MPTKQQQRIQRDLARGHVNVDNECISKGGADLGDVAQEHFGGLDAPKAHHDAGAPALLGKHHARRVHPHPRAAHVSRPPLVRARVPFYCAARHAGVLDRPPRQRNERDARVQRREEERLEQLGLVRMCVRRGWDEPCGLERGEEVVAQDLDVADRRGGDVVLGVRGVRKVFTGGRGRRTSSQNVRMALGDSSWCIRMHSS